MAAGQLAHAWIQSNACKHDEPSALEGRKAIGRVAVADVMTCRCGEVSNGMAKNHPLCIINAAYCLPHSLCCLHCILKAWVVLLSVDVLELQAAAGNQFSLCQLL